MSDTISQYVSERLEGAPSIWQKELCTTIQQALNVKKGDAIDSAQIKKCIGVYKNPLHAVLAMEAHDTQALMPQLPYESKLALNSVIVKEQVYGIQESGEEEAYCMARTCVSLALRKYFPLQHSHEWISAYYANNLGVPYEAATKSGTLESAFKMTDANSEAIKEFLYETSLWKMFCLNTAVKYAKRIENMHGREYERLQQTILYMRCALFDLMRTVEESDMLDTIERKIQSYGHKVLRYNRSIVMDSDNASIRALNTPILVMLNN